MLYLLNQTIEYQNGKGSLYVYIHFFISTRPSFSPPQSTTVLVDYQQQFHHNRLWSMEAQVTKLVTCWSLSWTLSINLHSGIHEIKVKRGLRLLLRGAKFIILCRKTTIKYIHFNYILIIIEEISDTQTGLVNVLVQLLESLE